MLITVNMAGQAFQRGDVCVEDGFALSLQILAKVLAVEVTEPRKRGNSLWVLHIYFLIS
jgi:hypothetical protein